MQNQDPIDELPTTATLRDVIEKLNELIQQINNMWHPSEPQ